MGYVDPAHIHWEKYFLGSLCSRLRLPVPSLFSYSSFMTGHVTAQMHIRSYSLSLPGLGVYSSPGDRHFSDSLVGPRVGPFIYSSTCKSIFMGVCVLRDLMSAVSSLLCGQYNPNFSLFSCGKRDFLGLF